MITKNPMQLKAFIKNKAAEKHISAQLVMQNYMLERLLERISLSDYKYNFILKGGFLISAIVGLDTRATMDLDTTIKGFDLTHKNLKQIFSYICSVHVDDDITFEIYDISDIRENDDYPGIRVSLKANYPPISVPLTVDVTTGDNSGDFLCCRCSRNGRDPCNAQRNQQKFSYYYRTHKRRSAARTVPPLCKT